MRVNHKLTRHTHRHRLGGGGGGVIINIIVAVG